MGSFPVFIFIAVCAVFVTGITLVVRNQLRWESEQASTAPEEVRQMKRRNYRIVVSVLAGTFVLFLASAALVFTIVNHAASTP